MKGQKLVQDDEVIASASQPPANRPISYLRFSMDGSGAVSTLPPPPFEKESDVAELEWWLESHMSLAGGQLCVEQATTNEDTFAIAVSHCLEGLRDALYEMYCDTADPRMRSLSGDEAPLGRFVRAVYATTEEIVSFMLDSERDRARAHALADKLLALPSLDASRWVPGLALDSHNPLEPLRNLSNDVAELASAVERLSTVLKNA